MIFSSFHRKAFLAAGVIVVGDRFAELRLELRPPELVRARTFVVGLARELELAVGRQPPADAAEDAQVGRTRNDPLPDGPQDLGVTGIRTPSRPSVFVLVLDLNVRRADLLVSDAAAALAGRHQQVAQHPGQSSQQPRDASW